VNVVTVDEPLLAPRANRRHWGDLEYTHKEEEEEEEEEKASGIYDREKKWQKRKGKKKGQLKIRTHRRKG